MDEMLIHSDNDAANAMLVSLGGSTSSGGALVDELLHGLGLDDSEMYGGYLPGNGLKQPPGIPIEITSQPTFGPGKYTTAWDLARLLRDADLAAGGVGPLARQFPSFTPSDARYLLYELAHVQEPRKIDRFLPRGTRVAHKAGWISTSRHDNGLVFWRGGSFVATVMTWQPRGAGSRSDVLAGRVAAAVLHVLRREHEP